MDDKQHEALTRMPDAGQPREVRVTFTVTVEMTGQQRDAYSHDHGAGFVSAEVKSRFPAEATEALQRIGWVRDYARVQVSDAKVEKG